MPTRPAQILALLQQRQGEFSPGDRAALSGLQQYRAAFEQLQTLPPLFGEALLEDRPLQRGCLPFAERWPSRQHSLAWARSVLAGVTTFAVDGSQIYPSKDFSVPVALVQIGWYENHHRPEGDYSKDVLVDLLTPTDFRDLEREGVDRRVNMRRFQLETERLCRYMRDWHSQHLEGDRPSDENCLVFLDGSLVATFAEAFDRDSQQFYVDCLEEVLASSERYQVPLVAYIDTSYARDLCDLLRDGFGLPETPSLHDAQLLSSLLNWGDRTPLLRCRRSILGRYGAQGERVTYTYLKTTQDGYPARLELPLWLIQAGLQDQVLDWVRAEVIVGGGYPYSIETADQTAVLTVEDRQIFYRLLQDWAERQGIGLRLSRKLVSKLRRR